MGCRMLTVPRKNRNMHHLRKVESSLKTLEKVTAEILRALESILVKVFLFGVFLYGLYQLFVAIIRVRG
jgi:preprotein translocase subunit SecE